MDNRLADTPYEIWYLPILAKGKFKSEKVDYTRYDMLRTIKLRDALVGLEMFIESIPTR